jgi:hypothetical protein
LGKYIVNVDPIKVNQGRPDEDMSGPKKIKGEKIMAKPIIEMFPGSNLREKHNWQRGIDKQDSLITHNDL